MSQIPSGRSAVALLTLAAVSSCVHYQAKPLAPATALTTLEARALNDPGLAQAVSSSRESSSSALPLWPPDTWNLASLTVAALYFQPDLEVARASWNVAQAARITAGERPNPGVSAGPGYNASTAAHTVTPWILNVDLDLTIETAGKRRVRIERAQQLSDSARFNIATVAWEVRTRLRQAFLDLFAATETATLLNQQHSVEARNLALLQRQLDAGEISTVALSQARLALTSTQLASLEALRHQTEARSRLAEAIGIPVEALDGVRLDFDEFRDTPVAPPPTAITRTALLNRADVLGALADYDASQSALQLEIARQYPDVHLGPGYQLDQGASKWTLLFPVTLPLFSRNAGPIAEAEARRVEAAAHVTAVQAQALATIDRAVVAYRLAQDQITTVDRLRDDARTLLSTTQRRVNAGDASQLDLGLMQAALAGRELARLDALVQLQQAAGDLENAMQRPLNLPLAFLPGQSGQSR